MLLFVLTLAVSPVTSFASQTKTCIANQALPDSSCTPGSILTSDKRVICVSGYTKTVRYVPLSEKKRVFQEYGIPYSLHSNYEVDHLISLELGGSNAIANLWPESYHIKNGSLTKDKFENYLHRQICNGSMSAQEAQKEISTNWLLYASQSTSQKTETRTQLNAGLKD